MPESPGTVAIIGASNARDKYGNKAVRAYLRRGWTVYPVNPTEKIVEGLPAYAAITDIPGPVERASQLAHLVGELGVQRRKVAPHDVDAVCQRERQEHRPGGAAPAIHRRTQARTALFKTF